ncbi:27188_t:CDS:2, partial [Gigaspora margarita]
YQYLTGYNLIPLFYILNNIECFPAGNYAQYESLQVGIEHAFDGLIKWMNLINQNQNTFGLLEALSDNNFYVQFNQFANSGGKELWKFPLIYEFIKYQIYSIMIHQQQPEGMFNHYDIKTHPNMDAELQQARIQISEKLQHIQKELRSSISGVEIESFTENAQ